MSATARGEAMPALAADDRRFRRRQVSQVRRKGRVERLARSAVRGLGPLLLALVVGGFLIQYLYRSPAFRVQRVSVRGNQHLSVGDVRALVIGMEGQHVFGVQLEQWRSKLLESPWVAEARVHRILPGTIQVAIVERSPLATLRVRGQLFLLDAAGGVIDEYGPQYADIDLPLVDGFEPGASLDPDARGRAALLGRLLSALSTSRDLLARVSQIDVSDARDAVVMLQEDSVRIHLGDVDFTQRLRSYLELKPALLARVHTIDYVDLRFGSRVFVGPAGGAARGVSQP